MSDGEVFVDGAYWTSFVFPLALKTSTQRVQDLK